MALGGVRALTKDPKWGRSAERHGSLHGRLPCPQWLCLFWVSSGTHSIHSSRGQPHARAHRETFSSLCTLFITGWRTLYNFPFFVVLCISLGMLSNIPLELCHYYHFRGGLNYFHETMQTEGHKGEPRSVFFSPTHSTKVPWNMEGNSMLSLKCNPPLSQHMLSTPRVEEGNNFT